MSDDRQMKVRMVVVYVAVTAVAVAVAVKLFTIQFAEGAQWRERAARVATAWHTVEPDRGNILAEDGRLLATTISEYEIRVDMVPRGRNDELLEQHIASLASHRR